QLPGAVGALPGELGQLAAEVAVHGGERVDRAQQVQRVDERGGAQVEDLPHRGGDLVGRGVPGAEGLDVQAHRLGDADRVRDLHLAAVGEAGGDDVLGDPAHRVGAGAVHLRGVLAGERSPAVPGHPAVGVDDDLAARQPGVALGAAEHEAAGGVDVGGDVRGVQAQLLEVLEHGGDDDLRDRGGELAEEVHLLAVLRGDHDRVDAAGHAVLVVADRDLGLAVGPQVGQHHVAARGGGGAGGG